MFNANFWRGRRGGEWKMEEEKHRDRKTLRVYSFTKGGSKIERKKKVKLSRVYHRNIVIMSSKLLGKRGSSLMFPI